MCYFTTYGDGVGTGGHALPSHVGEEARDLVLVHVAQLWAAVLPCPEDILAEEFLRDEALLRRRC